MDRNQATLRIPESVEVGEGLRVLDWSTLMARLAAERDLRREFAANRAPRHTVADFLNGAALVVGDSSYNAPDNAPEFNPGALANHQSTGGITVVAGASAPVAQLDARGTQ